MSNGYTVGAHFRTEPELPEAGVIRTDCPDGDCAERQPLPAAVSRKALDQKSPAEWAYQRLILYLQKFEEQLDGDHEIGLGFAGSDAGRLRIMGMGYFAPDIVTFYGVDDDGQRTQLVQHISQLNVMLKAMPKANDKPHRIGFHLRAGLDSADGGDQDGGGEDADSPEDGKPETA